MPAGGDSQPLVPPEPAGRKRFFRIGGISLILALTAGWVLSSNEKRQVLDDNFLLGITVFGSVPLGGLLRRLIRSRIPADKGTADKILWRAALCLVAGFVFHHVVVLANGVFDRGREEDHVVKLLAVTPYVEFILGDRRMHRLQLESWRGRPSEEFCVPDYAYMNIGDWPGPKPGDPLVVRVRPGALGLPWITGVDAVKGERRRVRER